MIKNIVIAVQSVLILAGLSWFFPFKHYLEQAGLVLSLGHLANTTRFMSRVEERIASGQCDVAQTILNETVAVQIADMKGLVEQLDSGIPRHLGTARDYANILHDVGIHEVSEWIERQAEQQDQASAVGE